MMRGPILMRRDLNKPLPAPAWPDGIVSGRLDPADASEIHALLRLAYSRGGGNVEPVLGDWWKAMSEDSEFDPDLCFVARNEDRMIVAFALCWTSSFVKDLVVHPDFQRRGIGDALLITALQSLLARGNTQVGLKVEADNPSNAQRLYERLDFVPA